MEIIYKKYILNVNDTIIGILKGMSNIPVNDAIEIFYQKNGNKTFSPGMVVYIPLVDYPPPIEAGACRNTSSVV